MTPNQANKRLQTLESAANTLIARIKTLEQSKLEIDAQIDASKQEVRKLTGEAAQLLSDVLSSLQAEIVAFHAE